MLSNAPVIDRVGESIRRSPFVWMAVTVLLLLTLSSGTRVLAEERDHNSTAWAIIAPVMIGYSTVVWAVWPRVAYRARRPAPLGQVVGVRWMLASMGGFVGAVAVIVGAPLWCYPLGLIVSVVLLALTVRWIRPQ